MIGLMCRDGFRQAEDWLRDGPAPPPEVAAVLAATLPADLRPQAGSGREEAVDACRQARDAGCATDEAWRNARVLDYVRLMRARAAA